MTLRNITALGKLNCPISIVGLVLLAVGCGSPYWMKASFHLPIPAPDGLDVDDHMGLFTNCKDLHFHSRTDSECSKEGARDWQFKAAALALVGVFGGFCATFTIMLNLCTRKCAGTVRIKVFIIFFSCAAASCTAAPLLMYALNNRFKVDPNLQVYVDFEPSWAYKLSAGGAFVYSLLVLTSVIDLITSDPPDTKSTKGRNENIEMVSHIVNGAEVRRSERGRNP